MKTLIAVLLLTSISAFASGKEGGGSAGMGGGGKSEYQTLRDQYSMFSDCEFAHILIDDGIKVEELLPTSDFAIKVSALFRKCNL